VCCRLDDEKVRLIDFRLPQYPPISGDEAFLVDDIERCVLCATCVATSARVLGIFRDASTDPGVRRLRGAVAAATVKLDQVNRELGALEQRATELLREVGR
jgi:hypothetical protein